MRNFYVLLSFLLCFLLAACGSKEKTVFNYEDYEVDEDEETAKVDENDEILQDSLIGTPSKRVDEYFDDFIYYFMRKPDYQRERIVFPLKHIVNGQVQEITDLKWNFNSLYARDDVYMSIFPSAKAAKLVKDPSVSHVVVQDLEFQKKELKQYQFDRIDSEWKLTQMKSGSLDSVLMASDFITFFSKFATDREFQNQHVADIVQFSMFDEETIQNISGTISHDQWPDIAPSLPTNRIMSVNYGQQNQGNMRVVNIISSSGDGSMTLTFKRQGNSWMLTAYES